MANGYPIGTGELVKLGLNELGKKVPVLGEILSVRDAVFGRIEMNRVLETLRGIEARVGSLEEVMRTRERAQTVLYGCDQARGDILFDSKATAYVGVIGYLAWNDTGLNQVVEVLDSLRKLSADDLRVLYQFKTGGTISEAKLVAELAGWTTHYMPPMNVMAPGDSTDIRSWRAEMERLYPSLMRLQGFGVLYLSDELRHTGGAIPPNIGAFDSEFRRSVRLTQAGRRLLQALPVAALG
jgi:hypothetical protein